MKSSLKLIQLTNYFMFNKRLFMTTMKTFSLFGLNNLLRHTDLLVVNIMLMNDQINETMLLINKLCSLLP